METVVVELVFGVAIGLLLGLVGGGGSILTVPILVYAIGLGVHEATATSLVIVGATALSGAVPHLRAGRVEVRTALLFGMAGIAGAFAGSWLNSRVAGSLILFLFGGLMLVVAIRMAIGTPSRGGGAEAGSHRVAIPASGLIVGAMTGLFGVGGGFLIVPALVLALGLPMRVAVGTSLVVIAINSASGIIAHLATGGFNLQVALIFVLGGIMGGQLGGRWAGRLDEAKLSRLFASVVALVGLFLIFKNRPGIW